MTPFSTVWMPSHAAIKVLVRYLAFATVLAVWSAVRGDGGLVAAAAYIVLLVLIAVLGRFDGRLAGILQDWLPMLALPLLYSMIPRTAINAGPFDGAVQRWDRLIFQTDPARTFAGMAPWQLVSELLHASYLSYYAIIFLPPFMMYFRGEKEMFGRTVHAFSLAMAVCFSVFLVFPVVGPRYLWPAPAGVPDGFFRQTVRAILEKGSSRGTAFPSSHQAIALATSLSSMTWDWRLGLPVLLLSLLIGLGAVYGGFHYGADMLCGALVGLVAWWWAQSRIKAAPA
jgi:membrane-associated phospholipid phosphatase